MTGFLASVASVQEARVVLDAGADVVDLKAPTQGVLGVLPVAILRQTVGFVAGRRTVSAATGDLLPDPAIVRDAVRVVRAAGVDVVKVGLFGPERRREVLRALGAEARAGTTIVVVLFADREADLTADLAEIARQGLHGVMLDTCDKAGRCLRAYRRDEALGRFVTAARELGLQTGLAGSLRAADIGPLLALLPDYLGFRGALCGDRGRQGAIDADAVLDIRTRIPVHGSTMAAGVKTLWRPTMSWRVRKHEETYGEDEIKQRLAEELPHWYYEDGWIRRKYKTSGWKGTLMVVNAVGHLAEAAFHHPDLTVSYAFVIVKLVNHAAKGVTNKDFQLARKIEEVIQWQPAKEAESALEGTPDDPRFKYIKYDT